MYSSDMSASRLRTLRILAISSGSASILSCLIAIYLYLAIHPSRRLFRHQLIFFLVVTDLFKSIAVFIYPIIALNHVVNRAGINAIGWFTALGIEGSDLAIFLFAIHTLLTIFYPQRYGGLSFLKAYVFWACFVIPVILASLAFINNVGYVSYGVYCYLPTEPIWYRMVLSWGPRYFIMLSILIIYCTIYFYVVRELKTMEKQGIGAHKPKHNTRWVWTRTVKFLQDGTTKEEPVSRIDDIRLELELQNNKKIAARYAQIARQMKVIFLYPIAYFLLWIFPMIQNSLRIEKKFNYPILVLVAFVQPLNGLVDTLVFVYREKPWRLTYENTPVAQSNKISRWRLWVTKLPLFHIPEHHLQITEKATNHPEMDLTGLDPNEFLHSQTEPDHICNGVDSCQSCKRNTSTDEEEDEDIDFIDFLNQGPPIP